MPQRKYYQFLFSRKPMLTVVSGSATFGASGAVSSFGGVGVQNFTKLTTGVYELKLDDNFAQFVKFQSTMYSGPSGSAVSDGSFVTNTLYQITTLGTTTWSTVGVDTDYTPAVGMPFVATAASGGGNGTATALAASGIASVELAQVQASMLSNNYCSLGRGSAFILSTLNGSATKASPASGSILGFKVWLSQSSSTY